MKNLFLIGMASLCLSAFAAPTINDTTIAQETSATATYSESIPVLFINTAGNVPIVSKEEYVDATYYLETFGLAGYEPLGSESEQLPLEIRGRGNSSWTNADKKPYKLKLGDKTPMMGMPKSKHFVLLAEVGSYTQFLNEAVGMELGRMIQLTWTPEVRPVEVVLNGEYIGFYLLTQNVRVDSDRVDIYEQPDEATDSTEITGGWLVEIDNYDDPYQIQFVGKSGYRIRVTHKTPEVVSPQQQEYLIDQMTMLDSLICDEDSTSTEWEKYIDIDYLARYYIVQEIIDNADAFHGSTYLFKEQGDDQKWIFGPLWDLGYSFWREKKSFVYEESNYDYLVWIKEIARYPNFQKKVREIWQSFYPQRFNEIYTFLDRFADLCKEADKADAVRWPQYNTGQTESKYGKLKSMLTRNVEWLDQQWGISSGAITDTQAEADEIKVKIENGRLHVTSTHKIAYATATDIAGRTCTLTRISDQTFELPQQAGLCILTFTTADNRCITIKQIIP